MMLEKFFAVTESGSLYVVESDGPKMTKIALKGQSHLPVGGTIHSGSMVSVGKQLISFFPESHSLADPRTSIEREIGRVNTMFWCGGTTNVVALFLDEQEARECLEANDLQPVDFRWLTQTQEVVNTIGDEHPFFSVSHHENLALL